MSAVQEWLGSASAQLIDLLTMPTAPSLAGCAVQVDKNDMTTHILPALAGL